MTNLEAALPYAGDIIYLNAGNDKFRVEARYNSTQKQWSFTTFRITKDNEKIKVGSGHGFAGGIQALEAAWDLNNKYVQNEYFAGS